MSLMDLLRGASGPQQPMAPPDPGIAPPLAVNIDQTAAIPRMDRKSATKLVTYIKGQYNNGLRMRRRHARSWVMVRAIMRGVHWFHIDYNGILHPVEKKRNEERAVSEIMVPNYAWMLGRLNANDLGVSTSPVIGKGEDSFWKADRAQLVLDNWLREINAESSIKDEMNQQLCTCGMSGLYRYIDPFRQQVCVKPIAGYEWFPLPYHATVEADLDGIMRAELVTKEWLEQQDEMWMREHPGQPRRKWAAMAGNKSTSMSMDSPALGSFNPLGTSMEGALCLTVWMKPSPAEPNGAIYYLIEDQLVSEMRQPGTLPDGRLPVEFVYFTKSPFSFWGSGFCETQIAPQLEVNRQLSTYLTNIKHSRPWVIFDPEQLSPPDMQQSTIPLFIPLKKGGGFDKLRDKIMAIPARSIGNDVPALIEAVRQDARRAGLMESSILFGQQEGRTESGPATNILAQNASTPLGPVVARTHNALGRTYPAVLDMLKNVWPPEKFVQSRTASDRVRETKILKEDIPWSRDVKIDPLPMIAGGRNAMMQILFGLRRVPGDNETPSAITTREMKRSLRMLGVAPPGIDFVDEAEARIMDRIDLLINDGQTPAVPSALSGMFPQLQAENHKTAIDLLKKQTLSTLFYSYGPEVQKALMEEMQYHQGLLQGVQPDVFDNAQEEADALQGEHILDAQEQDLSNILG